MPPVGVTMPPVGRTFFDMKGCTLRENKNQSGQFPRGQKSERTIGCLMQEAVSEAARDFNVLLADFGDALDSLLASTPEERSAVAPAIIEIVQHNCCNHCIPDMWNCRLAQMRSRVLWREDSSILARLMKDVEPSLRSTCLRVLVALSHDLVGLLWRMDSMSEERRSAIQLFADCSKEERAPYMSSVGKMLDFGKDATDDDAQAETGSAPQRSTAVRVLGAVSPVERSPYLSTIVTLVQDGTFTPDAALSNSCRRSAPRMRSHRMRWLSRT